MDLATLFVILGGLALIAFVLWFFFAKPTPKTPVAPTGAVVYACPMHPWIESSDPTVPCSLCGMQLVRRE